MFGQSFIGVIPKNTFFLNPTRREALNAGELKFNGSFACLGIIILVTILFFGGIGGAMAYIGFNEISIRSQLTQSGKDARATVTDVRYTSSTNKGRTSYTYYMTYEYFVQTGDASTPTRFTNEQEISDQNYLEFSEGSKITVQYLPDSPWISRYMADNSDDGTPLAVVGSVLAGAGLLILYATLRERSRNKRLENEGQLIVGKVVEAKGGRVKGGFQVTVKYSLLSPDGADLSRRESMIRNDLNKDTLPKEGTPVAVIYVHNKLFRIL